ncbi:Ger(x)C family spore germination protein [Cohnella sp. GCM10027633]|uniref:Ger(x)C family spore germination protein n=1 Tax=unclassified Cohnella TaxID=2636738 RepID=UPI003628FAB3
MLGRTIRVGVAFALCVLLAGCWDRVEIDQRGFVIGVAIDKPPRSGKDQGGEAHDRYSVTYQIVIPSAIKESNGKTGQGKTYFNITAQERSLSAVAAKMSLQTSRQPFMEHLKTIIVSSDMAKHNGGLSDVFDYFLRDKYMRRSAHVIISKGDAKKLLELEVPNEPLPALYLSVFDRNRRGSSYIAPQVRIGDVHEMLLRYETFLIPCVTYKDKMVAAFDSVAVVDGRTNRMVGAMEQSDAQSLNFIRGVINGGAMEFKLDGAEATFQIEGGNSEFKLTDRDPDNLGFLITIRVSGALNETTSTESFKKTATLDKAQNAVANEIEERCAETIRYLQRSLKKDAMGLGGFLYENHYRLWTGIRDNWDNGRNLFSNATIRVEATVHIRRSGNIDKIRGA